MKLNSSNNYKIIIIKNCFKNQNIENYKINHHNFKVKKNIITIKMNLVLKIMKKWIIVKSQLI